MGNTLWPLDLALALLGGLVLFLVLRLLSFEASEPLKNAWTYVLGVPTVLIAVSMLTHVLSNETVERSIQIGFLLSVSLHLILAFAAVNLVLFGGFWNTSQPQLTYEAARNDKQSPRYLQSVVTSAENAKREYLKPPKEPTQKPKETDNQSQREATDAPVTMVDSKLDIDTKITERSFLTERDQESVPQPTIASSAKNFDRPKLSSLSDVSNSDIALPELPKMSRTEIGELTSNEAALNQSVTTETERDSLSASQNIPETRVVPSTPPAKVDLKSSVQRSDINREMDRFFERQQRSEISATRLPRPTLDQMLEANTDLPPSDTVVPVPQLQSRNDGLNPADELSNLTRQMDSGRGARSADSMSQNMASLSPVNGPQLDLKPRALPSSSIGRTQAAKQLRIDERVDYLSGANAAAAANPDKSSTQGTSNPMKRAFAGQVSSGPIAASEVPLDEFVSGGPASGGAVTGGAAERLSIAPAESNLERNDSERPDSFRSGSLAVRGAPSIAIPSLSPAELTGPRDDLQTRGLGMRPVEAPLPEMKLSDYAPDRFKRPDLKGPRNLSNNVPIPTPAFSQRLKRMEEREGEATSQLGPLGPQTELAIERGLQFLAKYQRPDGSWHLEDFGEPVRMRSPTAATALALLSFQGAGYTHQQFKYENVCKGAVRWLIEQQRPNGDLYVRTDNISNANAWLYSHAMATLALCEAYGMTQDETIRGAAQNAIDFLVGAQDPQAGGWRYSPRIGSDTSVTGWVMMALKSAELSGLQVPPSTYVGLQKWIENSQAKDSPFLYRYNWLANTPSTEHGRIPTPVMTSVGLLIRLYTGWKRDNEQMQKGVAWLLERLPAEGTRQSPSRDTYYWYYATQVIFHAGGESWKRWYSALYPMLIRTQIETGDYLGSWDPGGTVPDAWGAFGGRLYVTTLNLLSLEVYYRHLPLYEATAE